MPNKTETQECYRQNMRKLTAVIAAVCFLNASAVCQTAPAEQKAMTDQQITNAVDYWLLTDSELMNNQIDVKIKDGIVTLSGTANNMMEKERAAAVADTIRGVLGVVNLIAIRTVNRTDGEIRNDVESALKYDTATNSFVIKPKVTDGIVTLNGTVDSFCEKKLAVNVAESVKGVQGVQDSINVAFKSGRADSEIEADVKNAIAADAWLEPCFITTGVKDGVVTLSGTVGSPAQHDRAVMLAWVYGVKSVNDDGLKIVPWIKSGDQRSKVFMIKGDAQIMKAVQDEFKYDPRVSGFKPSVDVDNSVVTLTGNVGSLKARHAAGQDATNITGVWYVKNLLKVRPEKPVADNVLAQEVNSAILRDSAMDGYNIYVKAKNGVVTLDGVVDSKFEKAQADDIASRANGVLNVKNNLAVNYPNLAYYDLSYDPNWDYVPAYYYWNEIRPGYETWPYTSDAQVKANIEEEIFWSPWVTNINLNSIKVKVSDGVVTLSGTVNNWLEFYKATEYAYTGGAQQVHNDIKVK